MLTSERFGKPWLGDIFLNLRDSAAHTLHPSRALSRLPASLVTEPDSLGVGVPAVSGQEVHDG